MLSELIEGVVLRHANVKITLKGELVRADGTRVAFAVTESFRVRSRSHVGTFWQAIANA